MDGGSSFEALLGAAPGAPQTESVWKVNVGRAIGADYVPMANDVLRMVCIQVAIQVMLVLSDPTGQTRLLSPDFLMLVVYITLGVMLYWLALRKLVVFV